MQDVLITGFKGTNNPSAQLVAALPTPHKLLLTNSFSGLQREIDRICVEKYAGVMMFGIDKALFDCIRLEQTAAYHGGRRESAYPMADFAERLSAADVQYEISSTPTQYLCNAAFFHMLERCQSTVFIHIPSLRGMKPILFQKLVDVFSLPPFCPAPLGGKAL